MSTSRWSLAGKKALITGGTRGIGAAIVKEFLQLEAEVFIVSKSKASLEQAIKDWDRKGFVIHGIAADLSECEKPCEAVMHAVKSVWSHLDILVNNVGTNIRKRAEDYFSQEYASILQTNLTSTFKLCQLAYPLLKHSSQGNIINISSISGLIDDASGAPYGVSKAGMIQLSKHLSN